MFFQRCKTNIHLNEFFRIKFKWNILKLKSGWLVSLRRFPNETGLRLTFEPDQLSEKLELERGVIRGPSRGTLCDAKWLLF